MIASGIDCTQSILAMMADVTDRLLDNCALSLLEANRIVYELFDFCLLQTWPGWDAQHSGRHTRAAPI